MADLARDIVRKRKIQLALHNHVGDHGLQPPENGPAHKRARMDAQWAEASVVDNVMLGSRTIGGAAVAVEDVHPLIPTRAQLPFMRLRPFRFDDRLGLRLTGGHALVTGTYPHPEDDCIVVYQRMTPAPPNSNRGVVRASPKFHGRPVYSFVELDADGEMWYGQVLLLFTCVYEGERLALALIEYLDEVHGALRLPNKKTFRRLERHPECVDLFRILRPVLMVVVPRGAGVAEDLFVLVDH